MTNKFKVGDLILGMDTSGKYAITCFGWKGTVTETYPDGTFDATNKQQGGTFFSLKPQYFKLINNKKHMTTKFKIGDRVKLISNHYSDEESNPMWNGICGQVKGTIKDIDSSNEYNVDWDNKQTNGGYTEDDLELVKTFSSKGMKNLEAATKALKRSGPLSTYVVYLKIPIKVEAADEDDAQELALEDFQNDRMVIVKNNSESILNTILM